MTSDAGSSSDHAHEAGGSDEGQKLTAEQRRRVEAAAPRVSRLARAIAPTMPQVGVDDLISAGNEGLVRAALRYDPGSGVPFIGFAHYRIRGAMIDCARRATPAVRRRTRAMRAMETTQSLLEQAQREQVALDAKTARSLQERVQAAADIVAQTTAAILFTKLAKVEPDRVAAKGAPDAEQTLLGSELRALLHEAVDTCTDSDRALIDALYFDGESMRAYAQRTGKSVSTVSRRHTRLLRRLSSHLRSRLHE